VALRDGDVFNMNITGDSNQNQQQYYMAWPALALDLDEWMKNAYAKDDIATVTRASEIFLRSVVKRLTLSNNANHPCEVTVWVVTPKRPYSQLASAVSGINPALITSDVETEAKTTAIGFSSWGHEPYMSSYFAEAFRIRRFQHRVLQPGQYMSLVQRGRGGVISKLKYGITEANGFNNEFTVMRPLGDVGFLIRARGTLVHNESKVLTNGAQMYATDLQVARGGFNLDCQWVRHTKYNVPLLWQDAPGVQYIGQDLYTDNRYTQAHESRWGPATHEDVLNI